MSEFCGKPIPPDSILERGFPLSEKCRLPAGHGGDHRAEWFNAEGGYTVSLEWSDDPQEGNGAVPR